MRNLKDAEQAIDRLPPLSRIGAARNIVADVLDVIEDMAARLEGGDE